jgi:hypothetical protein
MMDACDADWDEYCGCIRFGNHEMIENILRCARKLFYYILDSVKDDLQGYTNFRKCIEAEEKLLPFGTYWLLL